MKREWQSPAPRPQDEPVEQADALLQQLGRKLATIRLMQAAHKRRLGAIQALLQEALARQEREPFTYLEYLEFESAGEFERFRHLRPISSAEIAAVDWDELLQRLFAA